MLFSCNDLFVYLSAVVCLAWLAYGGWNLVLLGLCRFEYCFWLVVAFAWFISCMF